MGDNVKRDEILVEIETDKVVLEVPASSDGILAEITQEQGATVVSKQSLGKLVVAKAGDISSATIEQKQNPRHQTANTQQLKTATRTLMIKGLRFAVY
ncbi:Dihydrolipoyllysine-residue succinyltransferase component of 2-oxoglutarate dehydrogenase complex [Mannheimia haemolytica]|uniref:Dihydrolipoyllysine-residue succinyltransferase component of 2-oxoglutarate dehydrogenase complex n=1 Tax=Mannheimia haemolytica TaxID=75985 RepID=A0A378MYI4_MANHA|nr:Dihydrolipoyllysine-residue succinyltransferase component of 2-oxoglutarate dehydrogenase complex [Mannheimia haemolytica]